MSTNRKCSQLSTNGKVKSILRALRGLRVGFFRGALRGGGGQTEDFVFGRAFDPRAVVLADAVPRDAARESSGFRVVAHHADAVDPVAGTGATERDGIEMDDGVDVVLGPIAAGRVFLRRAANQKPDVFAGRREVVRQTALLEVE